MVSSYLWDQDGQAAEGHKPSGKKIPGLKELGELGYLSPNRGVFSPGPSTQTPIHLLILTR